MAAVPMFVAAGAMAEGTGAISVTWPSHQALDIGLLFVETANQAVATPSGWNAVTNGSQGIGTAAGTTATRLQVFWRRADTGAQAAASVADSGAHTHGVILTFRGCATSGVPVNASAGSATTNANTTAVSFPSITTTVNNCLVVMAIANQTDTDTDGQIGAVTNGSLTSITERFDQNDATQADGGGIAVITGIRATAGAVSSGTATLTTASRQGRVTLALLPNPDLVLSSSTGSLPKPTVSGGVTVSSPTIAVDGALLLLEPASSGNVSINVGIQGSTSLPEIQLSGSAQATIVASGAPVLPEVILGGSAAVSVVVSGSALVPALTLSGQASVVIQAIGSLALPEAALSGSASPAITTTANLSLPEVVLAGTSNAVVQATGVIQLPKGAVAGAVAPLVTVVGEWSMPRTLIAGQLSTTVSATGTPTLPEVSLQGPVQVRVSVSGSSQLPKVLLLGAVGSASVDESQDLVLPEVELEGSATVSTNLDSDWQLSTVNLFGTVSPRLETSGLMHLTSVILTGQIFSGGANVEVNSEIQLLQLVLEGDLTDYEISIEVVEPTGRIWCTIDLTPSPEIIE